MTHQAAELCVHAALAAIGLGLWVVLCRRRAPGAPRFRWRGLAETARWEASDLLLLLVSFVALSWLAGTLQKRWRIQEASVGMVGLAGAVGVGLALFALALVVARGQGLRALGVERRALRRGARGGATWFLLAYPAIYGALVASHVIFYWWLGKEPALNQAAVLFRQGRWWPDQVVVAAFAGLVAPVVEEVVYRGFLYGLARRTLSPVVSATMVSAVFALGHPPVDWAPIFLLGVALSLAYEESGTLLAPIFAHTVNNLYGLLLLSWARTAGS